MYLGRLSDNRGPIFVQMDTAPAPRLHEARLVGSYHAYTGAGDPDLFGAWLNSLSPADLAWIRLYRMRGEWGRLDGDPARFNALTMGVALGAGLASMGPAARAALQAQHDWQRAQAEQTLAGAMGKLGESYRILGDQIAATLGAGLANLGADLAGFYEQVERAELGEQLKEAQIPAPWADWLAIHWPAWAIPGRVRARLLNTWDTARRRAEWAWIDLEWGIRERAGALRDWWEGRDQ